MTRLFHLFIEQGPGRASGQYAGALSAVVAGTDRHVQWGSNGLFIAGQAIELCLPAAYGGATLLHSLGELTAAQRLQAAASRSALDRYPSLAAAVGACGPVPLVCAVLAQGEMRLYHLVHHTVRGALYLCYAAVPAQAAAWDTEEPWRNLLDQARPRWQAVRPLLSDDCAYSKWRSDIEMERKFTFSGLPDTWQLIRRLHADICDGALPGFVPELDRDFQVFDYESHIYAVRGEPHEQGYVSFIPQADGRMTVKRKWFTANAEIRRESLLADQCIRPSQIPQHVAELVKAPVERLPSFRRKRFDVNFESLATGNVYGIYFDICRTVERPVHVFSQCGVEYCRSRTFGPLRNVVEEFELVAGHTRQLLSLVGVPFANDLFSKLDFALQAAELCQESPQTCRFASGPPRGLSQLGSGPSLTQEDIT